jgi:TolB protein
VTSLRIAPAVNLLNFDAGSGIGLAAIADTTANSGLSWRAGQALFSGEVNGNRDIYLAQPGRNSPLNLTLAEGDDLQPAWSPDGRQIAFSSGRSGNLDIYVVNSQCILPSGGCDSKPTQLTTSRGFDEWPVWSPDSGKIAFVSDRDGNVEIYLMDANGSNQQRLTDHPADDWPAAWSTDGHRLVFASNRDGHWNLYVVEASGGEPARLTNDPADEREPVWSPDGRTIAFAYNGTGNWDIYTLPAPTNSVSETPRSAWTQITFTATDERNPTWLSQR